MTRQKKTPALNKKSFADKRLRRGCPADEDMRSTPFHPLSAEGFRSVPMPLADDRLLRSFLQFFLPVTDMFLVKDTDLRRQSPVTKKSNRTPHAADLFSPSFALPESTTDHRRTPCNTTRTPARNKACTMTSIINYGVFPQGVLYRTQFLLSSELTKGFSIFTTTWVGGKGYFPQHQNDCL